MHMNADARNSIIESMAPRAAANTLASMEDALQEAQDGRPESPEVRSTAEFAEWCVCVWLVLHAWWCRGGFQIGQ
jgi:hypothetical protein